MKEKVLRGIINGNNLLELTESISHSAGRIIYTVRMKLVDREGIELYYIDFSDAKEQYRIFLLNNVTYFID